MQRRPRNVIAVTLIESFGGIEHRQQHAEGGFSWLGFAFDDAAVIADDLGHQRQTQSAARRLGRDERVEQVRQQVLRDTGTVILDAELERQGDPRFLPWNRQAYAW